MHCERAETLLTRLIFDEVDPAEKQELVTHTDACPRCGVILRDLKITAHLLREAALSEPAPKLTTDRKAKILQRPEANGSEQKRTDRPRPARLRMRPLLTLAAAVLLIAVVAAISIPSLERSRSSGLYRIQEAVDKTGSVDRNIIDEVSDFLTGVEEAGDVASSQSARPTLRPPSSVDAAPAPTARPRLQVSSGAGAPASAPVEEPAAAPGPIVQDTPGVSGGGGGAFGRRDEARRIDPPPAPEPAPSEPVSVAKPEIGFERPRDVFENKKPTDLGDERQLARAFKSRAQNPKDRTIYENSDQLWASDASSLITDSAPPPPAAPAPATQEPPRITYALPALRGNFERNKDLNNLDQERGRNKEYPAAKPDPAKGPVATASDESSAVGITVSGRIDPKNNSIDGVLSESTPQGRQPSTVTRSPAEALPRAKPGQPPSGLAPKGSANSPSGGAGKEGEAIVSAGSSQSYIFGVPPESEKYWSDKQIVDSDVRLSDKVSSLIELENRRIDGAPTGSGAGGAKKSEEDKDVVHFEQAYIHVAEFLDPKLADRVGLKDVRYRDGFFVDVSEAESAWALNQQDQPPPSDSSGAGGQANFQNAQVGIGTNAPSTILYPDLAGADRDPADDHRTRAEAELTAPPGVGAGLRARPTGAEASEGTIARLEHEVSDLKSKNVELKTSIAGTPDRGANLPPSPDADASVLRGTSPARPSQPDAPSAQPPAPAPDGDLARFTQQDHINVIPEVVSEVNEAGQSGREAEETAGRGQKTPPTAGEIGQADGDKKKGDVLDGNPQAYDKLMTISDLIEEIGNDYREVDRLTDQGKLSDAEEHLGTTTAHLEFLHQSLQNSKDDAARRQFDDLNNRIGVVVDKLRQAKKQKESPPVAENSDSAPIFHASPVNPWVLTEKDKFSTFALDVDTASYSLCRNYILRKGQLPPPASVRMEEYVNAFDYNYPGCSNNVFTVHAEAGPSPFRAGLTLVKVGVRGKVIGRDGRKPAHLVFTVDASGSMARPDRLPLVQRGLARLVETLDPADRVSLVSYGTDARLLLESVPATEKAKILAAVNAIQCGGSTNVLEGLRLGYETARRGFRAGETHRVILCSDGVANVGATEAEEVLAQVGRYRDEGIACVTVGVGSGAYNDVLLEKLANRGDGSYLFVGTPDDARRVFGEEMSATLQTIAKDAKIQVEFDPARVRRYRLIGYENRDVADKDFRNDSIDAGEVGSGQSATALYELEMVDAVQGSPFTVHGYDDPANREPAYREPRTVNREPIGRALAAGDLGTVFVRYRNTETGEIEEIASRLSAEISRKRTPESDPRFALAACAAEFAEILRGSEHAKNGNLAEVRSVLDTVAVSLPRDQKVKEFLGIVLRAEGLPRPQ